MRRRSRWPRRSGCSPRPVTSTAPRWRGCWRGWSRSRPQGSGSSSPLVAPVTRSAGSCRQRALLRARRRRRRVRRVRDPRWPRFAARRRLGGGLRRPDLAPGVHGRDGDRVRLSRRPGSGGPPSRRAADRGGVRSASDRRVSSPTTPSSAPFENVDNPIPAVPELVVLPLFVFGIVGSLAGMVLAVLALRARMRAASGIECGSPMLSSLTR